LSTTADWGEAVQFLRYIPTSTLWVAPQMALKCTGGVDQVEDEDDEDAMHNNHTVVLGKYRRAIMDQGFNYFGDLDKLWWLNFFEKQEELLQTYLLPTQWRFEW